MFELVIRHDSHDHNAEANAGGSPPLHADRHGVKIGYRQFGSGPPIVMIVGTETSMAGWAVDLPKALSENYQVTIFDNRGASYSTTNDDKLSVELMAEDTKALIEALGLEKPLVIGFSMGGEIALAMPTTHPGLATTYITSGADAGGPESIPTPSSIQALIAAAESPSLLRFLFTQDAQGEAAEDAFVKGLLAWPDEELSDEIKAAQNEAEKDFQSCDKVWNGLKDVTEKIVLTAGTPDQIVSAENSKLVAEQNPRFEYVPFERMEHGMMFQERKKFVDLVKNTYPPD